MGKQKVLSAKYLPVKWPVSFTAVVYLFLDRFHASGMVKGVSWTLMGFIWFCVIAAEWQQRSVEPKDLLEK